MRAVPRKPKAPSCDQCFFRKNHLCALELDQPCSTFRPHSPDGLVPPTQPALLIRSEPPRGATEAAPALPAAA